MRPVQRTIEWVKEHPLSIVLVVGVIILFVVMRGGGSSSSGTMLVADNGPSDASVQASYGLAVKQIDANAAMYSINAQVEAAANHDASTIALKTLDTQNTAYIAGLSQQVSLAGIDAQREIAITGANVQRDLGLAGIAGQVQLADIANSTNLRQIDAQVAIGQQQSEVVKAGYNRDVQIATINGASQMIYASQATEIEKIRGHTQEIVAHNAKEAVQAQYGRGTGQDIANILGSTGGIISSIFGF